MASSPSFDQNDFMTGLNREQWNNLIKNPNHPLENKAIKGLYPPSSIFQTISAIAGLEEGVIDEKSSFHCPGFFKFDSRYFLCWKKSGHGSVDLHKALSQSCNVYFYHVGQLLGVDKLASYAIACGLGKTTGVNLHDEATGFIPTREWKKRKIGKPWLEGETLSAAIGQGYTLATPMQLAVMISAIANGGNIYKPQLINRIETSDGKVLVKNEGEIVGKLPIKQETLALVKKALYSAVNDEKGSAGSVKLFNIEISGKTNKIIGRGPDYLKENSMFIGYSSSKNSSIGVVVVTKNKNGKHDLNSSVPVAQAVIKQYLLKIAK